LYYRSAYFSAINWNTHTADNASQIERVQVFFFYYFFDLPSTFLSIVCPHDYYPVASYLGLVPLAERKHYFGNKFLKDLLTGGVDSPTLLSQINFKVPQQSSRSTPMFCVYFSSTNYLSNESH